MSFKTGDIRHDFQTRCPYNPQHQMPYSRLLYHITQGCADKAEVEHLFAHCPNDFLHVVHKANLEEHIMHCSSKNNPGLDINLKKEMEEVIKTQFKGAKKQQQQQQQQQIPGYSGQMVQKKKRKRNRKQKNQGQEEQGIPEFGMSSEDENK